MNSISFEWNESKNKQNILKHGVYFEEAMTVFYDKNAIEYFDASHSTLEESRFLLIGMSKNLNLLLVCFCVRDENKKIRIISARKAKKIEEEIYEQQLK